MPRQPTPASASAAAAMDAETFRVRGKQMVDYIANYLETIDERRVLPEVQPGYLRDMLPNRAPTRPEDWSAIMSDVEHAIMPGVCLCRLVSPDFHPTWTTIMRIGTVLTLLFR